MKRDACDYNCWDVGGFAIYGGELQGENFSSGFDNGINLFLNNVQFDGVIYVVDVSVEMDMLVQARNCMLDFVFSHDQLKESQFLIIFNKKKETLRK